MTDAGFYQLLFWMAMALLCFQMWLSGLLWRRLVRVCNDCLETARRANDVAESAIETTRYWREKYEALAARYGEYAEGGD